MPTARVLDHAARRLTATADGPMTAADVIAVIDWQIAEHAWTYALLYDTTRASRWPEPEEVTRIAEYVREAAKRLGRRGPVAVITRSATAFNAARQYAGVESEVGPVGFFTTADDAERWLGAHHA